MFTHPSSDLKQFRFFTSQLIEAGSCKPVDIIHTFGVSKSNVDRSLKKLREEGPAAFFRERTTRRGGKVFTPEVLKQAQQLLDQDFSRGDVAKEFGIKPDTLRKAIYDGRLHESSDAAQQPTTTKCPQGVFTKYRPVLQQTILQPVFSCFQGRL